MCGIVGIVYKDRERRVAEAEVTGMRDLLIYRGPDDQGIFMDGNAGLGHRRLSIIDLAGGQQPMTNEDARFWIVFNGEIYNFQDIREDLIQKGHVFRTKSDTEVILHLFEEKGEDCPADLNGIFAFAIWDKKERSLFLARDHMGIKPLYYAQTDNSFLFASEIKSIVQGGHVEARCNEEAIPEYFIFRHVAGENTLFQGVKSLLPAHSLLLKNGKTRTREYWSSFPGEKTNALSFDSTVEKLSFLIRDSVNRQLISDVPLGTLCSGGIDSSLVTAVAAGIKKEAIDTFSVGFYEKGFDETDYARLVSNRFKTNHHEVRLNNESFTALLPELVWHNDEPLNFANSVQIYAISKLAKEHVTVVLTGEGADELFGGYPRYFIPGLATAFQKLPVFAREMLSQNRFTTRNRRLKKVVQSAKYSYPLLLIMNSGFIKEEVLAELLLKPNNDGLAYRKQCLDAAKEKNLDVANQLSYLEQKTYLVSILMRQDKMSMAASIESRVPLLDYRIVELANQMPTRYKMQRFKTKMVLKKMAGQYLPSAVINRRKSGFGVPLEQWFRESKGLGMVVMDMVADLRKGDLIDKQFLEGLISAHKNNEADHSELLWTFVSYFAWRRAFILP
jgi:asparagine synthase (glutamine-hydrolysing)